ncbi:hypothetical protein PV327_007542 [Microctonus hyperodae]|uniref:TPX2 C-terminal domain-containing protein n=1 Tax=Microctonus hyperodae TaxID=165561 RepID=A0AA39FZE3_MICHY|nr:hypothetical protein PV327_007542 [Microctonus hyperodae]
MSMDDAYETSAPQWTDFSEITPNRHVEGDEYFDRILQETVKPEKHRNNLREKINLKDTDVSMLFLDSSKNNNLNVADVESAFMNDIDKIHMTPIKVTSPRTKNREPIVMQELSVNEVLTNAIKGLEIASSKSKNCQKLQILNATVCPSSTTNAKLTPVQRKIRLSRSMNPPKSNGKTPAAKAASTPRNINESKSKLQIKITPPEDCVVESIEINDIDKTIQNLDSNASICNDDSSMKFKTPRRITRSMHANAQPIQETSIKKTNTSSHIIKTPKLKLPIVKSNEKINAEEAIIKNKKIDNAVVEEANKNESQPEKTSVIDNKNLLKPEEDIESVGINLNSCEFNENNDNNECQNDEDFKPMIAINNDALETVFKVHRSNNLEHRYHYNEKPTLITNPARRRSSIIGRRRRSNKYISLAEAVSTFHRSTPTRFHTVSSKPPGPIQRSKQQPIAKNTIPKSPALKSKTRTRRNAVLSQAERENIEIENMRKHQIHANPVRPEILAAPEALKAVPKKPITVPRPFKLSGKPKSVTKPSTSAASVATAASSVSSTHQQQHNPAIINRLKRVMTLAPSENSQTLENQEILNFGIPVVENFNNARNDLKKKTTVPQPFPLVERHREFLNKKEEKLKKLQNEQANKLKYEFHARPVPAAVKKQQSSAELTKDKSHKPTVSHVQLAPFSFEGRDKMVAKKKAELRIKIQEEERKARVFHANPAPIFKPVVVRSVSRENIKIESKTKSAENLRIDGKINCGGKIDKFVGMTRGKSVESLKSTTKINTRITSVDNSKPIRRINSCNNMKSKLNDIKSRKSSVSQINNQENITPNIPVSKENNPTIMPTLKPKLKPLPIELHSDKRAKMRREYDEKMKLKLEQEEQRRKREQENRLAREQAEIAEIRKKAEIKARPMPVYKPLVVAKSNKLLTEPESPAWSKMKN